MGSMNVSSAPAARPAGSTPVLENGDRLTRAEFERRYDARPDLKAELIEGAVHLPSPTRFAAHARPHAATVFWLGIYARATPDVQVGDSPTIRLDLDNEPQPDAAMLITPEAGGKARIDEDDYVEGAPELIAEIAASSASYELHDKLHAYRRNGVREYLVWRTLDRRFDWFELVEGVYQPRTPDASGLVSSRVFPGLRLAVDALLRGDLPTVVAAQQGALGEPDYAAFVERLQAQRG